MELLGEPDTDNFVQYNTRTEDFDNRIFEQMESNVKTYCRSFPAVFDKARQSRIYDQSGRAYIDFLAGAGALNYGHNPEFIRQRLIEYLQQEGIVQGLDLHTTAKRQFLMTMRSAILEPRQLDFKVQFCGPTGANSVEAALKLARLATGRTSIVAFTGGWHGMTAGCLSVTGNLEHRQAAGVPLSHVLRCPFPGGPKAIENGLEMLRSMFGDPNSGVELPAAVILETVQGEGGVYVARRQWLKDLRRLCDDFGILLIVDDIQAGCGRTGSFFSFERANIHPDMVCLSKSIGGYGLPMSLLLMKPSLDVWQPGQHTGTFRGCQLSFVAATAALELWQNGQFQRDILERSRIIESFLYDQIASIHPSIETRGLGMMWGIDVQCVSDPEYSKRVSRWCFDQGLIVERCGRNDTTLKILPPLNISKSDLLLGLSTLKAALVECLAG